MSEDPRIGRPSPTRDEMARRIEGALARIASGRVDDAQRDLEQLLAALRDGGVIDVSPAPPAWPAGLPEPAELAEPLGDLELDRAFAAAEPEPAEMLDADQIAQQAMRAAELDLPEGVLPAPDSPFATRTMAELLERQGHADDARQLRARIESRGEARREAPSEARRGTPSEARRGTPSEARRGTPSEAPGGARTPLSAERLHVIATLERWLENLQRGVV